MNDIFGIPVEVLDSLPDGQVLLVNRKTWEQMKSAERRAPGRGRVG